ncbi:MAG: peptidylprolyl isomerase [Candidatus Eisenbacteria bacterium]|nr:peptidylprolyl isomerase [Candidatus Eisenbacteria bacterium]
MRRFLIAGAALLALSAAASADSTSTAAPAAESPAPVRVGTAAKPAAQPAGAKPAAGAGSATTAGEQVAVFQTVCGDIVVRLFDQDAPKTVANFRKLVQTHFYDGTYFFRVVPGFVIQGGDPNTRNADPNDDGEFDIGYTIPAEIKLPHGRGAVATARMPDAINPKRASSGDQFFIDLAPQSALDRGGYSVFGQVIAGIEAVDAIAKLAHDPNVFQGRLGPNPQRKALIKRAYLAPLGQYQKAGAAK